jgi:flagellar protein FliO/FliZ
MRLITSIRVALLSSAVGLVAVPIARAAGGEDTPLHLAGSGRRHAAASATGSSGILRTIVALVIVSVLIFAVTRIMKAFKGGKTRASGSGLTALATLPLGAGRSLALVRSGRDVVLLGVAEQGVTPIKTYTEAEALAVGLDVAPEPEPIPDPAERPLDRLIDQLRRLTVRS